jgi:hypothetical protein
MPYGIVSQPNPGDEQVTDAIVSATLRDSRSNSSARQRNEQTVAVKVNFGAATLANMVSWYNFFLTQVDAVSTAQVVDGSLTVKPPIPSGLKSSPATGSNVQQGGLYVFSVNGITYSYGVRVPALDDSQLATGTSNIDPTATGSDALISLLTGGQSSPINIPGTNDSWLALTAFLRGRTSTRK